LIRGEAVDLRKLDLESFADGAGEAIDEGLWKERSLMMLNNCGLQIDFRSEWESKSTLVQAEGKERCEITEIRMRSSCEESESAAPKTYDRKRAETVQLDRIRIYEYVRHGHDTI